MEMEIVRTHDELYLHEPRRNKEYFKLIYKEINKDFADKEYDLLDIGCATGDFLYYAKQNLKGASLYGMDIMKSLLDKIDFDVNAIYVGNVENIEEMPARQFDVVTMSGVLCIFDEFEKILDNAVSVLKEDGIFLLFGAFNPENIDVLIKARSSLNRKDNKWESGWNLFSIRSISDYLEEKGYSFEWIPFNLGIELEKNIEDPLRSYTFKDSEGKLVIMNGLQLVHNFYLCKIKKAMNSE